MTGVRGHAVVKGQEGWSCRCGVFLDANRDVARDAMNAHRIDLQAAADECEQCGQPAKYRNPALCSKHYQRWKAHGDFFLHTTPGYESCTQPGCSEPVKAYGYCSKHWRRIQKHGEPEDRKWSHRGSDRCAVPGCGAAHRSMGLCEQHYTREARHGHPIWRTPGRRKVHLDRPWNPDSVRDAGRITEAFAGLTRHPSSAHTDKCVGDDVNEAPLTQTCSECGQDVVPDICGERHGGEICTDPVCPVCGADLAEQEAEQESPFA